jgi:hypothetical protein
MKLSAMCIRCLMDRQEERVRECGDEEKRRQELSLPPGKGILLPILCFR